jgi:cyclic pyranopterin phosphate synthase
MDEVDGRLQLLPMAARRALDHAGLKVTLATWVGLELELRQQLVLLGSAREVDVASVKRRLDSIEPSPTPQEPYGDPPAAAVPELVASAFGPTRPIPDASWAALEPLERYALVKVAVKGREERLQRAYAEIVGASALSSHLEPGGGVRMVDVGSKEPSLRRAAAESRVTMNDGAFARLQTHRVPKGDVLGTARLAGIMAAKKTSEWIPLCHPLSLTRISIDLDLDATASAVVIRASVEAFDRTGVEMEALVAASAAALNVYDMLKSFDRGMQIGPTCLMNKSGGRTGDFAR